MSKEDDVVCFTLPAYICPKHGEIGNEVITSVIAGHKGKWCMVCYIENVIKPNCEEVEGLHGQDEATPGLGKC